MMRLWPPGHPPFRAGVIPAARAAARLPLAASGEQVLLADISQFQPSIADAIYVRWSLAIIIRAMYGAAVDDTAWYAGARRAGLHKAGVRWLGIYQYLTPFQDAAQQAEALVRLLGPLQEGEIPICDLEQGTGNQHGRWLAWRAVIMKAYPRLAATPVGGPLLYSGLDFAAAAGLDPQWVAAYQPAPPPAGWLLWQFTDSRDIPGIGLADCSLFDGSLTDLVHLITPASPPQEEDDMANGKSVNLTGSTVIVVPTGATSITFATEFGDPTGKWPDAELSYNASGGPYNQQVPIPGGGPAVTIPVRPGVRQLCVWRGDGDHGGPIVWDF
jgi:Glycosyl hydrolases family 25